MEENASKLLEVGEYAARCERLEAANSELQAMYVQVSEELEQAYRKHADSMAAIQSSSVAREKEVGEMARRLVEAQREIGNLESRVVELEVGHVLCYELL